MNKNELVGTLAQKPAVSHAAAAGALAAAQAPGEPQEAIMAWRWAPPVIKPGQTVSYHDHQGHSRRGECKRVMTHYTEQGAAYHIYEISAPHASRSATIHVSESQIVGKSPGKATTA